MDAVESRHAHAAGLGHVRDEGLARGVAGGIEDGTEHRQADDPGDVEIGEEGHDRDRGGRDGRQDVGDDADDAPTEVIDGPSRQRGSEESRKCGDGHDESGRRHRVGAGEHEPGHDDRDHAVGYARQQVGDLEQPDGAPADARTHAWTAAPRRTGSARRPWIIRPGLGTGSPASRHALVSGKRVRRWRHATSASMRANAAPRQW